MIYWCKSVGRWLWLKQCKREDRKLFHVLITAYWLQAIKLVKDPKRSPFTYCVSLLFNWSLSVLADLHVAQFSDTATKCEGFEKEKMLWAWCTTAHDTCSYLHPDLQSLTLEIRVFWRVFFFFFTYLRGTKRHLSALSWSQWQCIVWLWGGKWIVFLPLGYAGTNTRNNVVVAACFHQLHTPIQRSSSPHSYLSSRSCPPFFLRHNDP